MCCSNMCSRATYSDDTSCDASGVGAAEDGLIRERLGRGRLNSTSNGNIDFGEFRDHNKVE